MATATGYRYHHVLTLGAAATVSDYVTEDQDAIEVIFTTLPQPPPPTRTLHVNPADADRSGVDFALTDTADEIQEFEIVGRSRIPGVRFIIRWSKASIPDGTQLRLHYGKENAEYVGTIVAPIDTFQDFKASSLLNRPYFSAEANRSRAFEPQAILVRDGFAFFCLSHEREGSGRHKLWAYKFDLFTQQVVDKQFVRNATQTDERHNHGYLFLDSQNRLHFAVPGYDGSGAESTTIWHARALTPYGLDFSTPVAIPNSMVNLGGYYLQFTELTPGTIRIHFRDWSHYYVETTDYGLTWANPVEYIRATTGTINTDTRVYAWIYQPENGGDYYISWSYSDGSGGWRDLGAMKYSVANSQFEAIDGTAIVLPARPNDASFIEDSGVDERFTSGLAPYVDSSDRMLFAYLHGFDTPPYSNDLRLRVENKTTQVFDDVTVTLPGVTNQIDLKVGLWESDDGATKYMMAGEAVTINGRIDWKIFSASDWVGPWTDTGFRTFENEGNVAALIFPKGNDIHGDRPPLIVGQDTVSGDASRNRVMVYLPNPPAYINSWVQTPAVQTLDTQCNAQMASDGLYGRTIGVQNNEARILKPLVPGVDAVVEAAFCAFFPNASTGRNLLAALGWHQDDARFNETNQETIHLSFTNTGDPGTSLRIRSDDRTEDPVDVDFSDPPFTGANVGEYQTYYIKWRRDDATGNVSAELFADPEMTLPLDVSPSTILTDTALNPLNFFGFSTHRASSNVSQAMSFFMWGMKTYRDHALTKPTYQSWSAQVDTLAGTQGQIAMAEARSLAATVLVGLPIEIEGATSRVESSSGVAAVQFQSELIIDAAIARAAASSGQASFQSQPLALEGGLAVATASSISANVVIGEIVKISTYSLRYGESPIKTIRYRGSS